MKRVALLLILGCAVVLARNVVITNPTTQPIPIKQVASSAPIATPTASPAGTATATPTATATASAGTGLADGDPVSSWVDSSGNGHNATQSGTARPTFKTNILNGKPAVRFNSAASTVLNLTTTIPAPGNVTYFVVGKRTGAKFAAMGGSADPTYVQLAPGGGMYSGNNVGYITTADATGGAFHVITSLINAPTLAAFYTDGTEALVGLNGFPNAGVLNTIGAFTIPGHYTDGDIAEIIIYSGPLALRTKLTLLLTVVLVTGEFPSPAEFDAMVGHRDKIAKYLHKHGAKPTKAQLDAVVTPMTVGDRANIEKYLGTKYGITVAGGTAVDPLTVAGLQGWWKADSLADFNPTTIAGLKGWWKADTVALTDGANVPSWPDSSGSGNFGTTGGGVQTYKTNVINGLPVVRFVTANSGVFILNKPLDQATSGFTAFGVAATTADLGVLGSQFGEANSPIVLTGSSFFCGVAGTWKYTALPNTNWHVYVSSSSPYIYVDGVNQTLSTSAVTVAGLINVIGYRANTGYSSGDVAEALLYQGVLSTTDRQKVEAYLKTKYATP